MFISMEEREGVKLLLQKKVGINRILGRSKAVNQLRYEIECIAPCDVTVLISGESGTGKELTARAIHYLSERSTGPFIPVNCGAIPENLFENELFGHRKGAFTDATLHQEGLVREAEGGTLFLDEIGVISPYIQVKLLRLLQDKEYKALGESKPHKANIRIIAATNQDLSQMVQKSLFREDLFYRLNIVSIGLPPLRERKEDIPLLVDFFLEKYSTQFHKTFKRLPEEIMDAMLNYSWPGNIRELENKVQQVVVKGRRSNVLMNEFLQLNPAQCKKDLTHLVCFKEAKQKAVDSFEREYLMLLMAAYNGDVVNAARRAGKSRTALWNLLSKHNLHPKQFRQFMPV